MARQDKLLARFRRHPADFTWDELMRLLRSFGYEVESKGRTSGSRVASPVQVIRRSTFIARIRGRSYAAISCARCTSF